MKTFSEFNEETGSDIITVKVSKAVADEIQNSTLDVSNIDYGKLKGNTFIAKKKNIKELIRRWKIDYGSYGLDVSPARKKGMVKLIKELEPQINEELKHKTKDSDNPTTTLKKGKNQSGLQYVLAKRKKEKVVDHKIYVTDEDEYMIYVLTGNYDGKVRGGIRYSWKIMNKPKKFTKKWNDYYWDTQQDAEREFNRLLKGTKKQ